jgi:hypothetical protein
MMEDDSVYFFTLVDFLLTALFFGLVLFAIEKSANSPKLDERAKAAVVDSIRKAAGISDITVLTDVLTRLAPLQTADSSTRLVKEAGGVEKARKALELVSSSGGSDSVAARLARLMRREGAGKPHCLFVERGGRKEAIVLATVIGTDSTLTFERETPELASVLASIDRRFSDVQALGLRAFRKTFERLQLLHPECLYTIEFVERTRYVEARDAARGLFYMRIRH